MLKDLTKVFYFFQLSTFLFNVSYKSLQLFFSWMIVEQFSDPLLLSTLLAMAWGSKILFIPLFGALGDVFEKHKILLLSVLFATLLVVVFSFSFEWIRYQPIGLAAVLIGLALLVAILEPVEMSYIPFLVDKPKLEAAYRIFNLSNSFVLIIGAALSGTMIGAFGYQLTLVLVCGLLLAASVFCILLYRHQNQIEVVTDIAFMQGIVRSITSMKSGFKTIWLIKTELGIALVSVLVNFIFTPFIAVLLPLMVSQVLQLDAWYLGLLDIGFGVGMLLTSLLFIPWFNRTLGKDKAMMTGVCLFVGTIVWFGIVDNPVVLVLAMIQGGVGLVLVNLNTNVLRSLAIPRDMRSRMSAIFQFSASLAIPLGTLTAGWLVDQLSLKVCFWVWAGISLFIGPMMAYVPHLLSLLRRDVDELDSVYRHLYPEAFQ